MLILSRKVGERVVIGDDVTIVVQRLSGGRVSLAIHAPRDVRILRGELDPFGDGPTEHTASAPKVGTSEALRLVSDESALA